MNIFIYLSWTWKKCLIIKDKEKNIEKIYADKIMYGPDGKRVIKMTWEFI